MSATLINLLIQIVGGAIGGNGAGATLKNLSLGPLGNTLVGGAAGGLIGQILPLVLPMLSGANGDVGAMAGQLVGGGIVGAAVTALVGAIKNSATAAKS
jgi:hypothetical protein